MAEGRGFGGRWFDGYEEEFAEQGWLSTQKQELVARFRSISRPHAFSIIEVLIALSIVIAIAAIAMPNLVGMSKTVRMQEAGRIVEDAVAEARTEAQKRGVAIRLHAETTPDGRTVLVGKAASVHDVMNERLFAGEERNAPASTVPGPFGISHALVWAPLPEGCSLDTESPADAEPKGEANPGWEPNDEQKTNLPKWLWVVLPDGAVSSEHQSTLKGPGDRRASLVVNRWTGSVRVRELASGNVSATTGDDPTKTTDASQSPKDEESGG